MKAFGCTDIVIYTPMIKDFYNFYMVNYFIYVADTSNKRSVAPIPHP